MAKNRKQKILKAAEQMVKNRRFHEITVDDIAAAAGVGKGTIYRYFENKEDLFFQLATGGIDQLCERLTAAASTAQPFRERLVKMCSEISRFHRRRFALIKVINDEEFRQRRGCEMRQQWHETRRRSYAAIRDVLAAGVDAGEIRGDIPLANQAVLLMGMMRGRGMALRHNPDNPFEIGQVIDLFLDGARGRGGR